MVLKRRSSLAAVAALLSLAMISAVGAVAEEQRTSAADGHLQARRLLELAQELYLQEHWLEAGEAYLAAYEAAPVAALMFNAGQAFRRGGACERSLECLRRYVADDDVIARDEAVQFALAASRSATDDEEACRSVERLHRAIFEARRPTSEERRREAQGLAEEAQERYLQERFLEAAELFEQAYEVRPHPAYLWNIGISYLRAQQWLESVLAFEHYLAERPVEVRRHPAAVAAISALDAEPYADDPRMRALCRALYVAMLRADCETTAADARACLLPTARRLAGEAEASFLQERFLDAAQLYGLVNDLHPDPAFLWNVGLSYLRAGEWLGSQRAFERYLAESPVEVRRHPAVVAAIAALDAEPYAEDERARALCIDLRSAIMSAEREQATAESEP